MQIYDSNVSCGIKQIVDLDEWHAISERHKTQELKFALRDFHYEQNRPQLRAAYIFSDVVSFRNGSALAAFIRKKKLGTVPPAKKVLNPVTGRTIQLFVWYPDNVALRRFMGRR